MAVVSGIFYDEGMLNYEIFRVSFRRNCEFCAAAVYGIVFWTHLLEGGQAQWEWNIARNTK